jgi:hypothetical protein
MTVRYAYIPIRVQHVKQVSEFADGLEAADSEREQLPAESATALSRSGRRTNNNGGITWGPEEYLAFKAAPEESYRRVRAFGGILAARPGRPLTTSAAADLSGVTSSQIRAALGKFTTWMGINIDNTEWPFGWAYGPDIDADNPHEFHYMMSAEQAKAWRRHMAD